MRPLNTAPRCIFPVKAQSLTGGWFGTSGAGADMHHLRPCDPGVNSSRGNKKFGTASGYYDASKHGADYRGDVARIIFYLMVRYPESDNYSFSSVCEGVQVLPPLLRCVADCGKW